ncbi:MAG: hypothetical protein AABW90_00290 [Nanoarchaeota archaeon]
MVNKLVSCLSSAIKFLRLPKSKRSQSHVEIILSMTLFVGFLIFIFLFLNPAFRTKQELPIKDVQEKVIENISSNMGKLSVIVNTSNDCYSLDEVNDEYGNNFIEIDDNKSPRRYTIYYGNFFDPLLISCSDRIGRNFSLGSYTEESIIVYEKIKELRDEYENNYGGLKTSLNIGDFSFKVKDLDGNFIAELGVDKKIPENINVASKDIPIKVIDNKGKFYELILNIKTWG